jgi:protein-disulfide isomerase
VASEAALSAGAQGQFFEMDRLIFSQQKEIPDLLREKAIEMDMPNQLKDEAVQREVFIDLAAQLNLDQAQMRHDLENQTYLPQVEAETADSLRVGAKGTPASFINGRYLSGAKPFETFQKEIQSEIDWARNGNRPDFEKGTDIAELIPAWQREPDPDKVYDLEAGDASYLGASNAKVTILHYLDYQ